MNLRIILTSLCAGLIALAASNSAYAQGRGMRMGSAFARLLNMPEVQKELNLDSDLLEKVKAFAEASQAKIREEVQNIQDQGLSEADTRAEMTALTDQLYAKDSEELAKIISADQMKRFKQLLLQQQGLSAVTRKEVAEAIGLKEDARAALKKTLDEMSAAAREKMQELFQSGDRDEIQKIMAENRKKVDDTVLEALDDSQEAKFKELKGPEFKFPEPQAPGSRRRDF